MKRIMCAVAVAALVSAQNAHSQPVVMASHPSDLKPKSATAECRLISTGADPAEEVDATLYMGDFDRGGTTSGWPRVVPLGKQSVGMISAPLFGLSSGWTYTYRFRIEGTAGVVFTDPVTFTTPPHAYPFILTDYTGIPNLAPLWGTQNGLGINEPGGNWIWSGVQNGPIFWNEVIYTKNRYGGGYDEPTTLTLPITDTQDFTRPRHAILSGDFFLYHDNPGQLTHLNNGIALGFWNSPQPNRWGGDDSGWQAFDMFTGVAIWTFRNQVPVDPANPAAGNWFVPSDFYMIPIVNGVPADTGTWASLVGAQLPHSLQNVIQDRVFNLRMQVDFETGRLYGVYVDGFHVPEMDAFFQNLNPADLNHAGFAAPWGNMIGCIEFMAGECVSYGSLFMLK